MTEQEIKDHEDWYDENGERHPWWEVHVDLDKVGKELEEDPNGRKVWSLLDRKDVKDYDGFWTNYSLYFNKVTNEYVTGLLRREWIDYKSNK